MYTFILLQLTIFMLAAQTKGAPFEDFQKAKPLDGRIVGGIQGTIQQFPHQVSLQRNGRHYCGAVVIHYQVLLTAAHCVYQQKPENVLVHAGSSDLYEGGAFSKVRAFIYHEAFNFPTNLNNDIALIILEEPLKFNSFIRSIPLMTNRDFLPPRSSFFVSGWGTTSLNIIQSTTRLRYTIISEIDHTRCMLSYRNITTVTPNMICAGAEYGGRDSCQGDSGGPLVARIQGTMKLLGIVSWGISCADPAYPGVYTRVSQYEGWIRQQMRAAGVFIL